MPKKWRLIERIEDCAAFQMALDEAIVESCSEDSTPTLRFYTWKPSAVTIGYFQSIEKEVDLVKADSLGIDVVRRYTGGGAVLHDKELTYSVVMPEMLVPSDIIQSYNVICSAIISGLRRLGIAAQFNPINDILVEKKKISGNAQTRKQGVVLQHGTILIDVDIDRMFSVLKVPDEKLRDKMISAAKDRVTSVSEVLGRQPSLQELEDNLVMGFEEVFKMSVTKGRITSPEKARAHKLFKEKYSTHEWNRMR